MRNGKEHRSKRNNETRLKQQDEFKNMARQSKKEKKRETNGTTNENKMYKNYLKNAKIAKS